MSSLLSHTIQSPRHGKNYRGAHRTQRSLGLALFLTLVPTNAEAMRCGPTDHVIKQIEDAHHEATIFAGLLNPIAMLRIWLNPETQTWTATITTPDKTCITAYGLFGDLKTSANDPKSKSH